MAVDGASLKRKKHMWLLAIAVMMAVLKALVHNGTLDIAWVANLSWWWVIGLFGLTSLWWAYADASGFTRRKVMERVDARKAERLRKSREALGAAARKRK